VFVVQLNQTVAQYVPRMDEYLRWPLRALSRCVPAPSDTDRRRTEEYRGETGETGKENDAQVRGRRE
jgi:hypothetical protein